MSWFYVVLINYKYTIKDPISWASSSTMSLPFAIMFFIQEEEEAKKQVKKQRDRKPVLIEPKRESPAGPLC